jgi:hypothetical protein
MSKVYQVTLSLPLCSGRAVRYRQLLPTERDTVAARAANDLAQNASNIEYRLTELREGVKAMLVAVTKEPVCAANDVIPPRDPRGGGAAAKARHPAAPSEGDPLASDALWEPLDVGKLTMPGAYSYDALFTPKDDDVLCKLYARYHEARPEELEAIVGKALEVSAA